MSSNFPSTSYLTGAHRLDQAPPDTGREVAFAGRSNAGKSSALNTITGNRQLARISRTPGRTQLLHFFQLDSTCRLVDLPGYGFARVPQKMRQHWDRLLSDYLENRMSLQGLVLIMDIRHPLKPTDAQLVRWCQEADLPLHILLTKADKLSKSLANQTLAKTAQAVAALNPAAGLQLFSSRTAQGLDEARRTVLGWLEWGPDKKNPG
jgi:GTP-binding protein